MKFDVPISFSHYETHNFGSIALIFSKSTHDMNPATDWSEWNDKMISLYGEYCYRNRQNLLVFNYSADDILGCFIDW